MRDFPGDQCVEVQVHTLGDQAFSTPAGDENPAGAVRAKGETVGMPDCLVQAFLPLRYGKGRFDLSGQKSSVDFNHAFGLWKAETGSQKKIIPAFRVGVEWKVGTEDRQVLPDGAGQGGSSSSGNGPKSVPPQAVMDQE